MSDKTAGLRFKPTDSNVRWLETRLRATERILADRERELLELKGPCSNRTCRLHYAHSGPCDCASESAS